MTTAATEAAYLALAATLAAADDLPALRRDAVFDDVFDYLAASPDMARALVMRAGDAVDVQRVLPRGGPDRFEIVRNADLEFYVAGAEGETLNQTFEAGLSAIFAAIEADATLGGAVADADIVDAPDLGTDQAGALAVLTALVRVQLTFLSPRAY
jgi:hypothetical protein